MRSINVPVVVGGVLLLTGQLLAGVSTTGDVSPDPSTTTSADDVYVGNTADGSVDVDSGSTVESQDVYLGYDPGVTGSLSIDGPSSLWSGRTFYAGYLGDGIGMLSITDGAQIESVESYLGYNSASSGTMTMDGAGTEWIIDDELYIGYAGHGDMNITNGAVVMYTAPHTGFATYLSRIDGSSGNLSVSGVGSTFSSAGELYVGYNGDATVTVEQGGVLDVRSVDVRYGSIHVDGANSRLDSSQINLRINSELRITSGAQVTSSAHSTVGRSPLALGLVEVDGEGSSWTISQSLSVGRDGNGKVVLTDGGYLSNTVAYIGRELNFTGNGTVSLDGPGTVWQNTDVMYIGYTGQGTLEVTGGALVQSTDSYVGYSTDTVGVVTLDGADTLWDSTGTLYVGYQGNGTLNLLNGAQASRLAHLGYAPGSMGTLTVNNPGGVWTALGAPAIGYEGHGVFNILNGTHAVMSTGSMRIGERSGSVGEVTVDGDGSILTNNAGMRVGMGGAGTLRILNNAVVNSINGDVYVGVADSEIHFDNGTLNAGVLYAPSVGLTGQGVINAAGLVSDFDLVFDANSTSLTPVIFNDGLDQNITVNITSALPLLGFGYGGEGSATVKAGVVVSAGRVYLGYNIGSHGTVTVEGPGSTWNVEALLGFSGDATLNILDGGKINSEFSELYGTMIVDGVGSVWTQSRTGQSFTVGSMFFPNDLPVTLSITNGGHVNSSGSARVTKYGSPGQSTSGPVSVVVDGAGSMWTVAANLTVGSISTPSGVTSSIAVTNGAALEVGNTLSLRIDGQLTGDSTVSAGLLYSHGSVLPGNPTGTLHVDGNYEQSYLGKLHILLNDTGSGSLAVTGTATIAGTLVIEVVDGTTPVALADYTILSASGITGTFATVVFPDVTNMVFSIDYNPTEIVLHTLGILTGDANNDGVVDAADFLAVEEHMGARGTKNGSLLGDANDDGRVDGDDWVWVEQHLGDVWQPLSPSVPEPGTLVFLCALLCGATQRPRALRRSASSGCGR